MIARINRRPRKKRIVILGGGFGGVYAAMYLEKLLARRSAVEICLVSHDNFFFPPMLHEIAASDLDLPNKRVLISRGYRDPSQQVDYDHLANPKVE
jgi:NADH dehydrogenase FAD-containing subunit